MKEIKRSVILWLMAGVLLSLCTLGTVIYGINSSPAVLMDHTVAIEAAEQVLEHARAGDYDRLGQLLYGSPDLGQCPEKTEEAESLIWYAFLDSIQYQIAEACRVSGSGVELDVHIQCLDISAVMEQLQTIAPERMAQLAKEKTKEEEIYDKDKNYLPEFVAEVLRSATAEALAQPQQTMERTLTLELTRVAGSWQVIPTEELMHFLSGFVAE